MHTQVNTVHIKTISAGTGDEDTSGPDIEELLAYKDYLEKELQRVKTELRKKVQR